MRGALTICILLAFSLMLNAILVHGLLRPAFALAAFFCVAMAVYCAKDIR